MENTAKRILMINDPKKVQPDLRESLEREGLILIVTPSLKAAHQDITENGLPVGLLINLEGIEEEGLEFCNEMTLYAGLPVIILGSTDSNEQAAMQALVCADAYLRPNEFSPAEIAARLERLFSRISSFTYGLGRNVKLTRDIVLDLIDASVVIGGYDVTLTPTEVALLHVLLTHDHEVVDSETLIERVWRGANAGNPNSLRVHMHRLRRKLGWKKRSQMGLIKTVRGIG